MQVNYLDHLLKENAQEEEAIPWEELRKSLKENRMSIKENVGEDEILYVNCSYQLLISRNREEKEIFVQIHLTSYENVFKRILTAIKYIFGYKSRYGSWDCVVLDEKTQKELVKFLTLSF
jgi:hypothetical protein